MKEVRIYKTRRLADVAILNFYADNKSDIQKVVPAYKSRGIYMKDGKKIYFRGPETTDTTNFTTVTHY